MSTFGLMLASKHTTLGPDPLTVVRQLQANGRWMFEFKYDGVRALIQIEGGVPRITNRNGRNIGVRYPDVIERLTGLPDVVLDGEIICADETGRPDFHRIHRRDAQNNGRSARLLAATLPAQFVVFDVLARDRVDLRMLTYLQRREQLHELAEALAGAGIVGPPVTEDGEMAWRVVQDMNLEGLVAKRKDSRYIGRRGPAWVKIKATRTVSALVCGWDEGTGHRASTFGALRVALLDDAGELVPCGSVGSGFSDADVQSLWRRLQAGDHPIIVEVSFLEVSPSGQLRQPVFRGVRQDVPATECSLTQLND